MYSVNQFYKFELTGHKGKIFYTGRVVEEDEHSIKIHTTHNEELILNKSQIAQAKLYEGVDK